MDFKVAYACCGEHTEQVAHSYHKTTQQKGKVGKGSLKQQISPCLCGKHPLKPPQESRQGQPRAASYSGCKVWRLVTVSCVCQLGSEARREVWIFI